MRLIISILDKWTAELHATERLIFGLALIQMSNKSTSPANVKTDRNISLEQNMEEFLCNREK